MSLKLKLRTITSRNYQLLIIKSTLMDLSLFIAPNSYTRNPQTKLFVGNSPSLQYKMLREVCSLLNFSGILFLLEQSSRKAYSLSSKLQLSLGIWFALLMKTKIFASQLQMSKQESGCLVGSTVPMKMARSSFPIRRPTKTSRSLQSMEISLSFQISLWRQKNMPLLARTCTTKNHSCKEVKLKLSFTFPWA